MTVAFDRPDSIEAPVTKGEQIGTARVLDADRKTVRELALRAAADEERLGFLDLFGALCRCGRRRRIDSRPKKLLQFAKKTARSGLFFCTGYGYHKYNLIGFGPQGHPCGRI